MIGSFDLQGSLNAVGLVLVVLAALRCLAGARSAGSRPAGPWSHRLLTCVLCVVLYPAGSILLMPLHWEGHPVTQWLVPTVCACVLILTLRTERSYTRPCLWFFAAATVLSLHAMGLAMSPSYTDAPARVSKVNRVRQLSALKLARRHLEAAEDSRTYPAGWLQESPARRHLPQNYGSDSAPVSRTTHRLWHTWLTGLHAERAGSRCELWYPGGTPAEAAPRLELRVR